MPWFVLSIVTGCGSPPPEVESAEVLVPLSAEDRAIRVSMAVRGVRPTGAELEQVRADPNALEGLVDQWMEDPAFGETIRDMHAELLQVRTDLDEQLQMPSVGALGGWVGADIISSNEEEVLKLIELVVTDDRPYTEVVQSKTMMANAVIAGAYGLAFDPKGPEWQETVWADGRPMAGILSSSELYRRHISNGTNFHRGRANILTKSLVCDDFATRDLPLEGTSLDLADPLVVANAVVENEACAACHQALDGAAAFLWGFHEGGLDGPGIEVAIAQGCVSNPSDPAPLDDRSLASDHCFPLVFYSAANEDGWADWGLRPPTWYGTPGRGLEELGALIAADPRFSLCTARRFYSYLTQTPLDDVPQDVAAQLQGDFVASGYSAKALVKDVVLSDRFLAASSPTVPIPGPQVVRPEQYARLVHRLTGFTWVGSPDEGACFNLCLKRADLMRTDRFGFRAMSGGIDGFEVLDPVHAPTPVKALVMRRFATEAAAYVARGDLSGSTDTLLHIATPTSGPEEIRAQIVALHSDILGEFVLPDDPAVDETYALFETFSTTHDPADAWALVVSALLQDPALVFY